MKRYTSRFLKSVAVFYLSFPVIYLVMIAVLFNISAPNCLRVLLSPFYYLVAALAVVTGYGLREMSRWAWYVFIPTNILILYQNAILANDYGETHYKGISFAAFFLLIVFFVLRVAREVRVPYFFPKIRWWESNPRYRTAIQVKICRKDTGEMMDADILDLSLNGCFAKLRADFKEDETLTLNFTVFGLPISAEGNVVWVTHSTVTHPKGIGVKFSLLQKSDKRALKLISRKFKKIATLYRTSRYLLNQEEFLRRLEEIETRGPERRLRWALKR